MKTIMFIACRPNSGACHFFFNLSNRSHPKSNLIMSFVLGLNKGIPVIHISVSNYELNLKRSEIS